MRSTGRLLVVLGAWFIETILLSTTAYCFSSVWYAGRIYGVLSSCFVLVALLSESTLLYARLAVSMAARERECEGRMMTMDALAASMAHNINQPLAAIVTDAEVGLGLPGEPQTDNSELVAVMGDIVADGRCAGGIVMSISAMFKEAAYGCCWTSRRAPLSTFRCQSVANRDLAHPVFVDLREHPIGDCPGVRRG